jgi:hypothetical protein
MDGRLTAGLALGLGLAAVSVAGEVTVFPHPRAIESSPDYRVEVEGQEVFCYRDYRLDTDFPPSLFDMRVSPQAYAIFDFTGTVRVRVTVLSDLINSLDALEIRPLTAGIRARVAERTVEFVLDRPGDVTVDPQGTGLCVLHLFTNAPETDVPSPTDPDVIYFGPGVHDIDDLELRSGHTLYLAGGAVLRPCPSTLRRPDPESHYTGRTYHAAVFGIRATGSGVRIRGRGVISGERGLPAGRRFGLLQGSVMTDLRMEGVVFARATGWTVLLYDCRGSRLDRVRVLGYFTNSDGICLHSCRNVTVRDCFVHTADDCYEVKSKGRGLVFEQSQAWCDAGTAMGVTHEVDGLRADHVARPEIRLMDPSGEGLVRDIAFRNLTINGGAVEASCLTIEGSVSGVSLEGEAVRP